MNTKEIQSFETNVNSFAIGYTEECGHLVLVFIKDDGDEWALTLEKDKWYKIRDEADKAIREYHLE